MYIHYHYTEINEQEIHNLMRFEIKSIIVTTNILPFEIIKTNKEETTTKTSNPS